MLFRSWGLVLLVVAFLFAALSLVPVKARFLLPAVPFLALLAARGSGPSTAATERDETRDFTPPAASPKGGEPLSSSP